MGLLTRHAILAHGNFMSAGDFDLAHHHGAGIAHCPLSNFTFANSVFPLRRALDRGVHVGLGTDIAGGHSPSIFDTCRHALVASRALSEGVDPALASDRRGTGSKALDHVEAFWLATAGGAEALDLPVGSFEAGRQFDAISVDLGAPGSNVMAWEDLDGLSDVFQKIVYNATRSNIAQTWVAGRLVHG
jgi:guanine deaminase